MQQAILAEKRGFSLRVVLYHSWQFLGKRAISCRQRLLLPLYIHSNRPCWLWYLLSTVRTQT